MNVMPPLPRKPADYSVPRLLNIPTADILRRLEEKNLVQEVYDGYPVCHVERIENAYDDIDNLLAMGRHLY